MENINYQSNFKSLVDLSNQALQSIPSKVDLISILNKNNEAYEWTKAGMKLHTQKHNCLFCGNTFSDERYDELVKYFENESARLKELIFLILEKIAEEEKAVQQLTYPISLNDFNDGFREESRKRKLKLDRELNKYKELLKKITGTLKKKATEKIYTPVNIIFKESDINALLNEVELFNQLIDENNEFVQNFENTISAARNRYKEHLVAVFLKQNKFLAKKSQYEKALEKIKILDVQVAKHNNEIGRLNSLKESDTEGCAQFNFFVKSFLNRDDIEIRLNALTKKFNLMRGADLAQNLSEGEKMAIAFSHFLVNLKSIEQKGNLKDYIVYIDDPISSLDSNHIFQINSLLKEVFFEFVPDPLNPKNNFWQVKCNQFFISTHNFEFFALLKELPKKGYKKDSRYFITRAGQESVIEKLPNVYNTFSSEYHFLFGEILGFTNEVNKSSSPKLLFLPNILRRFLEMYTLTKFPSNDEVDTRAEKVFGKKESKRILKLLHHFSHFNSIDRIHKHSEFIADIEHACNDLVTLIKTKDKMHYDALEASV